MLITLFVLIPQDIVRDWREKLQKSLIPPYPEIAANKTSPLHKKRSQMLVSGKDNMAELYERWAFFYQQLKKGIAL
jgi:hypothetical protein